MPLQHVVKTHNTVNITVEGLDILVSAKAFSVDGGQEWRTGLDGVASGMRDAIGAAMKEAARRDASDPEILADQRRPTTNAMPAQRPTEDDPESS